MVGGGVGHLERGELHGTRTIAVTDPDFIVTRTKRYKGNFLTVRRILRANVVSGRRNEWSGYGIRGSASRIPGPRVATWTQRSQPPNVDIGDKVCVGETAPTVGNG